jgi:hypothetical protein
VLLYRVFPHLPGAGDGEPGHALYVHPDQGRGRWDNPSLYRAVYVASSPSAAIGETFAHLSSWTPGMLPVPTLPGASRSLASYLFDEEAHPLLSLDDAKTLLERGLRPTDVVVRNRPRTQRIAREIHAEGRWAGLTWWSMHRPQWTLHVLWRLDALVVQRIEHLAGHPGLIDAAGLLAKELDRSMR